MAWLLALFDSWWALAALGLLAFIAAIVLYATYYQDVEVKENARAFYYKQGQLQGIKGPGQYYASNLERYVVEEIDDLIGLAVKNEAGIFALLSTWDKRRAEYERDILRVDVPLGHVGLLRLNGHFNALLRPGVYVFWRVGGQLEYEIIDATGLRIDNQILAMIQNHGSRTYYGAMIAESLIADHSLGALYVDGVLRDILPPGQHAFWIMERSVLIKTTTVEQALSVSNQTVLTRDHIPVRMDILARYRVTDPWAYFRFGMPMVEDRIYKAVQMALRQAAGASPFTNLQTAELEGALMDRLAPAFARFGLALDAVGLVGLALPQKVQDIMDRVTEAEQSARANLIRRREEFNAAQAMLKTARLMEEHPGLARLKEWEAIERIAEKAQRLTLIDGVQNVLGAKEEKKP